MSRNKPAAAPGKVTVAGTIDAKNAVDDCNTRVLDGGYNLSSDSVNPCKFSRGKHDRSKADPELGSLGQHGGFARTAVPARSSPAVDAVPLEHAGCVKGSTDQRGVHRPQPTGGRCDVGAVEVAHKAK